MDRSTQSSSIKKYTYQDLIKVEGHPYFFENPINKKKVYRKGSVKISTGTTSIKEARRIVQEELDRRAGLSVRVMARKRRGVTNPLISDAWNDLLDERRDKRAHGTVTGYGVSWKYGIEPFWGNKTADQINQSAQREYESWYMRENSTRIFFNTGKHLGMLFRYMKRVGYINEVPEIEDLDERIKKITKHKPPGRVYTEDEQNALLRVSSTPYIRYAGREPATFPWQLRAHLGTLFGLHAGVRKMEMLSAKKEQFDLNDALMDIWSSKNGKWRSIPMSPKLVRAVEVQFELYPESEYLFPMPSNPKRHISSQIFDKAWVEAKRHAKIKGRARFHDLRHTFATKTAIDKWSPLIACRVLDMSLKEYERTYTHITDQDIQRAMTKSFGWGA